MSNVSNMVVAMQGWDKQIDVATTPPSGMFGRKIVIKSGNVKINGDELDIEFSIPFDDDPQANEAEIIVYNLSKTTISNLKKGNKLTVTAGYGGDTGLICEGKISKVKTKRLGVDKQTTIYVLDNEGVKETKIASLSFKKGVKASYILKTLLKRTKLPIAVFKVRRDKKFTEAVTVDGKLMENIEKYAKICGVSAYIHKGKIYCRWIKDGNNGTFTLKADTGLIGAPEEFEEEISEEGVTETIKGYKVTMLLQHRIEPASVIKLTSQNVSGTYRVRRGEHKFDGSEFVTECEVI